MKTRHELISYFFGGKMPRLWCPPLTHYTQDGELDTERIKAHWKWMRPHVPGFLVPGSTGDGWEMSEAEIDKLFEFVLRLAPQIDAFVLFGVLKTEGEAMVNTIKAMIEKLQRYTGESDVLSAMKASRVYGITVCPPKGAFLTQEEIGAVLKEVLAFDIPTAIYQLPQVTENEISTDLFLSLAEEFSNFILLKDTSGEDRIALEAEPGHGVFLVRGAEGRYAEWLKESGGPYDGLLLSTCNCFALHLDKMIQMLELDQSDLAQEMSDKLTAIANAAFGLVAGLSDGNPFANANKAIDHFMAFGEDALQQPPPRLHAGSTIPNEVLTKTMEILRERSLLRKSGYMNQLRLF